MLECECDFVAVIHPTSSNTQQHNIGNRSSCVCPCANNSSATCQRRNIGGLLSVGGLSDDVLYGVFIENAAQSAHSIGHYLG